jgi:hypothetical protein
MDGGKRARRRAAAAAVLLWPAVALAEASFPPSTDRAAVLAWLPTATDLSGDQVVGSSPSSLIAILSQTGAGRWREVVVRGEALTPAAAAASGALSFQTPVQLDCVEHRARAGATQGYATRTPSGQPIPLAPADPDWSRPQAGSPLDGVWRVVCEAPGASAAKRGGPASGAHSVQLASSATQAGARSLLARLRGRLPAGLEAKVEAARPHGRQVYRAVVAGFPTHQDAEAFCVTARRNGQACLAR